MLSTSVVLFGGVLVEIAVIQVEHTLRGTRFTYDTISLQVKSSDRFNGVFVDVVERSSRVFRVASGDAVYPFGRNDRRVG